MDERIPHLAHQWERIRWARLHRTEFTRAKDAAESLNIKPGTYRTYEYPLGEGGREPPLSELQRIARKFKVSWVWLATGEGHPDRDPFTDERLQRAAEKVGELDPDKQEDAWAAVYGVLDAFRRKAS